MKINSEGNGFLLVLSFVSGACVMAMEISAARLLAPYFGTSVFVWTNIIGVVLIALSVGYVIGGKLADKHPERRTLLVPLLVAGCLFLFIPWILPFAAVLTSRVFDGSTFLIAGSLFVTFILFGVPLMLLGMVSPFVIRLLQVEKEHLGELSGRVFALSTVGSILGTFAPTLYLIPTIGTRATVALFASMLVATCAYGLLRGRVFLVISPVFLLPMFALAPMEDPFSDTKFVRESSYQYIRVRETQNGTRVMSFNEGRGIQSVYFPDRMLTGTYYDFVTTLVGMRATNAPVTFGMIGLAGGTIPRQIDHYFGENVEMTVAEIDPSVVQISRDWFGLPNRVQVFEEDGRTFLQQKRTYDVLFVDAYTNELYIPWTMVTREFWEEIKKSLSDNGMVVININATKPNAPLLLAIQNTMTHVFPEVKRVHVSDQSWNYLLVAGEQVIFDPEGLPDELAPLTDRFTNAEVIQRQDDLPVFTDDWAPVELMTDKMLFPYAPNRLKKR